MTLDTWDALWTRICWYAEVLAKRLDTWPARRIVACRDEESIKRYVELVERNSENIERMKRHQRKLMH